MQSIKISFETKAKIEEKQAQLLLNNKKKISQSELLERIVLAALDDPDFIARVLQIDPFPGIEDTHEIIIDLPKKLEIAPAPILFEDEWED